MPERMRYPSIKRPRLLLTAAAFVFVTAAAVLSSDAYALRVTLKRVIFEGPKRTELLTIVNNTAEEQAFRLGWRMMRMTEDKSLQFVKEGDKTDDLKPAEEMIRYSPRRVVLPPGGSQQIRLMLRRPKDLAEGEYRSHFWIQPEAESVKFDPENIKKNEKGPTVQIKMLTGMTVPVFVRNGDLSAKATITDATMTNTGNGMNVKFTLNREGNRSLYGDMKFFCAGGGDEKLAHEMNGLAVYTEVTKRFLEFKIPFPEEIGAAACSKLHIKYIADEEDSQYKGAVMAETLIGG